MTSLGSGQAARPAKEFAAPQITHATSLDDWSPDISAEDSRLSSLRRQLVPFGLTVHRMAGPELSVTGSGFARCLPDFRSGWLLVRQLRGAA